MSLAAYIVLRPLMLRWGTHDDEHVRPLPGDDLIMHPHINATYAIDIPAAPRVVWYWLLKLVGAGTGLRALRGLQDSAPTNVDTVVADGYRVVELQTERLLVLSGPMNRDIASTHIWALEAISPHQTRLIFRYWQAAYGLSGIFYNILSEPLQFVLRQVMLKALRQRARPGTEPAVFGKEKSNGNIRIPLEN
jgi:hypothetical protein